MLELSDIQSELLRPRPSPYLGTYVLLRIDDATAGKAMIRGLLTVIASAARRPDPSDQSWVSVAFTWNGLRALGVPDRSLASFPQEFRQGMAARAGLIGDVGTSAPEHWERPFGTPDVHAVITAMSSDPPKLIAMIQRARTAYDAIPGVEAIYRQDCYQLPDKREQFGFVDGISDPVIEGAPAPDHPDGSPPVKPGEFVLGYDDETGHPPPMPYPPELGRNGTFVAFRKISQDVSAFRTYLRDNSTDSEGEELLAAKIVGRWRSGAPLSLAPDRDAPELVAYNEFRYADDPRGLKTPLGSHTRRTNPRDTPGVAPANLHRLIRRATSYGPPLPGGVITDDGQDRGTVFAFFCSHLRRQFEFVQSQWINDGATIGAASEKDPLVGANDGTGSFTVPGRPIRRRLRGLPQFVTTRGGEYCFLPGLSALRWLAEL